MDHKYYVRGVKSIALRLRPPSEWVRMLWVCGVYHRRVPSPEPQAHQQDVYWWIQLHHPLFFSLVSLVFYLVFLSLSLSFSLSCVYFQSKNRNVQVCVKGAQPASRHVKLIFILPFVSLGYYLFRHFPLYRLHATGCRGGITQCQKNILCLIKAMRQVTLECKWTLIYTQFLRRMTYKWI